MSEPVEGTFVLRGLIDGKLRNAAAADTRELADFIGLARKLGLRLTLQCDGNGFSLLADEVPVPVAPLKPNPQDTVRQLLEQLVVSLERVEPQLYSTLRSSEYRPGAEIQTVYPILPDGSIPTEEREIAADTRAPRKPLTPKQLAAMAGGAVAVVAVVLLGLSFLIDFSALKFRVVDSFGATVAPDLSVDTGNLSPYLTARVAAVDPAARAVFVEFTRSSNFPVDLAGIEAALPNAGLKDRLALETLARGYTDCELYGPNDLYLGNQRTRIRSGWTKPTFGIALEIPRGAPLAAIRCGVLGAETPPVPVAVAAPDAPAP